MSNNLIKATNQKFEQICQFSANITSPVEDEDDNLYTVSINGEFLKFNNNQLDILFKYGGQPSGVALDQFGKNFFIADLANQAVLVKPMFDGSNTDQPTELVKEFEGQPLLGPNSLVVSTETNCLYFTDSGPFGETNIENPQGSVFMIDLEAQLIRPIALNCLAYPSGLALSKDEKTLYVCETCNNTLLKFTLLSQDEHYFSTFAQFSGRFGPVDVTVSNNEFLYVAQYEFGQISSNGLISILNIKGQILENLMLNGLPEINGISFSQNQPEVLYLTENSNKNACYKITVQREIDENQTKAMQ